MADTPTSAAAPKKSARKRLVTLIKLAVGLGLLAMLLFPQNAVSKVISHLKGIDPFYVVVLLLISVGTNLINSLRWRLFVTAGGGSVSCWRTFKLALVGKFFNNFMPGMVGGDIARILILGQEIGSTSRSAASVIMERTAGLAGLIAVAALASIANPAVLRYWFVALPVLAAVAGGLTMIAAYFSPRFSALLIQLSERLPLVRRYSSKIRKLIDALFVFRERRRTLMLALALAVTFHFIACINVYVASLAIQFYPSFWDVLVITPVILLITAVPVSPRGIGWWEWCFGVLFAGAGGTAAQGVAVALTLRATSLLMSLLGGVFFLTDRGVSAPVAARQER